MVAILQCSDEHGKSLVLESRQVRMGGLLTIRRRRQCTTCDARWWTVEIPDDLAREVMEDE